jgi:hypothetical protein
MTEELASLILELLREMRAELGDVRSDIRHIRVDFATKSDLNAEIRSLRADVAADILSNRKELSGQIDGLRQTVKDYHAMALRVCPSRVSAPVAAPTHGRIGS